MSLHGCRVSANEMDSSSSASLLHSIYGSQADQLLLSSSEVAPGGPRSVAHDFLLQTGGSSANLQRARAGRVRPKSSPAGTIASRMQRRAAQPALAVRQAPQRDHFPGKSAVELTVRQTPLRDHFPRNSAAEPELTVPLRDHFPSNSLVELTVWPTSSQGSDTELGFDSQQMRSSSTTAIRPRTRRPISASVARPRRPPSSPTTRPCRPPSAPAVRPKRPPSASAQQRVGVSRPKTALGINVSQISWNLRIF